MKASDNPFYVLKASPRDRKSRLTELTDDAALHGDHEAAVNARNVLSNPRARLAAEVAWFPGLSPKRVERTLEEIQLGNHPSLDGMNTLSRANFVAEALKIYADGDPFDLQAGIEELSTHVEELDPDEVLQAINEDRQAAGIPAVNDASLVEAEFAERVRHFERMVTECLEDLPAKDMVNIYEGLVSWSTNEGEDEGQRLINALIDVYELKASSFLNGESDRITKLIDAAKVSADRHVPEKQVRASVNEIIEALKVWDSVAQPIQLAHMSRGLNHGDSKKLAFSARSLALHLFNEHDYLEDSTRLSNALQALFAEVASVNDKIKEDVDALENIAIERAEKQREEAHNTAEFAREITYETTFGTIFKDKFRISPEGFDFKGTLVPLDKITGVRWGAVRKSVNGIPTGTDYLFGYGTSSWSVDLQPNEHQYKEIIQRAWRAVCIQILLQWMEDWSNGRVVKIGGADVADDGIVLRRSRFFSDDEQQFFPWTNMTKSAANGFLNLYGKSDSRFKTGFSYKDVWNIHIFDFAVDKIWEGKARKLSKIFGQ